MDQYTHFNTLSDNGNLFISEMDEGRMTRIKNRLTNKDYLASRCIALGLDRYILFGEDDHDDTMDPKEDVIEAIIGAAARRYLEENGYWRNIADADIEPQLDLAVNQLQELYQKRYIDKAEYEFVRDGRIWYCTCSVGRHSFKKHGHSKPEAKKRPLSRPSFILCVPAACMIPPGIASWMIRHLSSWTR